MQRPKILENIIYGLKAINSPFFIIFNILYVCLQGFKTSVLSVLFLNIFIDKVESRVPTSEIVGIICIFAILYTSVNVVTNLYERYYSPSRLPKIKAELMSKLFDKSIKSDIENFDNPSFYNDYVWTMTNIDNTIITMIENIAQLINNIIITIFICGLFISINTFILITIIASVGITVLIYYFVIKLNFNKNKALAPLRRKSDYFERVFYLKKYSKELRITDISNLLFNQFEENEGSLLNLFKYHGKKLMVINMINGITISTLMDIGLRVMLAYQLMVSKSITLGEFSAASVGMWSLFSSLNGIMGCLNKFPESSLYIKKMKIFMNKEPKVYVNGKQPVILTENNNIKFDCVNFSYDKNTDKKTLKNISFELKQGSKIAIVGENGSGKTTLVNMILGLYEADSGDIYVNNKNLKELDINSYRQIFDVVFQDFSVFATGLAENVVLDLNYDSNQVERALTKSLFYKDDNLKSIPINAIMSKEFDNNGIVLSGGQLSKLTTARAFLDKQFIIMDEPSSALDALSETTLNDVIINDTGNKIVVIISHRLATAKRADHIIVVSKGEIIEQGSHEELMDLNGVYYEMYTIQAEQYAVV